jgi:hypothetical protein
MIIDSTESKPKRVQSEPLPAAAECLHKESVNLAEGLWVQRILPVKTEVDLGSLVGELAKANPTPSNFVDAFDPAQPTYLRIASALGAIVGFLWGCRDVVIDASLEVLVALGVLIYGAFALSLLGVAAGYRYAKSLWDSGKVRDAALDVFVVVASAAILLAALFALLRFAATPTLIGYSANYC